MNSVIDFDVAKHGSTLKCLDPKCSNMHNFTVVSRQGNGYHYSEGSTFRCKCGIIYRYICSNYRLQHFLTVCTGQLTNICKNCKGTNWMLLPFMGDAQQKLCLSCKHTYNICCN